MEKQNQLPALPLTEMIEAKAIKRKHLRINQNLKSSDTYLRGKRIVISGSFTLYDRRSLIDTFHIQGAIIEKSISDKTDYLIAGNETSESKIISALNNRKIKILFEKDIIPFFPIDESTKIAYSELITYNSEKAKRIIKLIPKLIESHFSD